MRVEVGGRLEVAALVERSVQQARPVSDHRAAADYVLRLGWGWDIRIIWVAPIIVGRALLTQLLSRIIFKWGWRGRLASVFHPLRAFDPQGSEAYVSTRCA